MSETTSAVKTGCVATARLPPPLWHTHNMRKTRLGPQSLRPNFIRQWREYRGYSLERLASMVPMDKGNLSKVERSIAPYTQPMLERLADALMTEPASLLIRDPSDHSGIWSLWDQAKVGEQQQIVRLAQAVLSFRHQTGTDG